MQKNGYTFTIVYSNKCFFASDITFPNGDNGNMDYQ